LETERLHTEIRTCLLRIFTIQKSQRDSSRNVYHNAKLPESEYQKGDRLNCEEDNFFGDTQKQIRSVVVYFSVF